jgi:hypothetical protein
MASGVKRQIAKPMEIEIIHRARGDVVGIAIDGGLVHQSIVIGAGARGGSMWTGRPVPRACH